MSARITPLTADDMVLQLAEPRTDAFTADGWLFELKLDGFRLLVERIAGRVRLIYRRGRDSTATFPEVVAAIEALPGPDFILDGELVAQDASGRAIFQLLLTRSMATNPREIARHSAETPTVFFAFDLLMLDGADTRALPLRQRKELLARLFQTASGRARALDHVERDGLALLKLVKAQGLEGIVAKRADAPYRGGRSETWLKVALKQQGDFAVCGFAADERSLHLATWNGARFEFAGSVGSGVTPAVMSALMPKLTQRLVSPVCSHAHLPTERDTVWVVPDAVIEVRYKDWPQGLLLREPTFVRVRDDKVPTECVGQVATAPPPPPPPPQPSALKNASKVYFPGEGITKGEVVAYYDAVAPWLLPYLRDRPLMLTRYPDGITGKSFFQKGKPAKAPDFIRTLLVHNEEEGRDIDQIVCDDARTLHWCASMAAIPLHLPAGRVSSLHRADWCVIDFDPKEAPFEHVMTLALGLKVLCDALALPSFVKTSGASGLHVLIPLGQQLDHDGARQLAEMLASLLAVRFPKIATTERMVAKRQGRVYVDALQNGFGKLIAAPLCVRAKPGAPVSMPLQWHEVRPGLSPTAFTIRDAISRLERLGDPLAPVLSLRPDIAAAIGRVPSLT